MCLQVLREPYQATCCGYSFCKMCIERIKGPNHLCPCCKADQFDHFPNKGLQRSLYEFKVTCTNKDQGCQWVGELGQLESHLNLKPTKDTKEQLQGCQLVQIQCLYCLELVQRSSIQLRQNEQCPKTPFCCKHCGDLSPPMMILPPLTGPCVPNIQCHVQTSVMKSLNARALRTT